MPKEGCGANECNEMEAVEEEGDDAEVNKGG